MDIDELLDKYANCAHPNIVACGTHNSWCPDCGRYSGIEPKAIGDIRAFHAERREMDRLRKKWRGHMQGMVESNFKKLSESDRQEIMKITGYSESVLQTMGGHWTNGDDPKSTPVRGWGEKDP